MVPNQAINLGELSVSSLNETIMFVLGYFFIVWAAIYAQISNQTEGIISRGFDAGLSIGLLIVGLIVIGWYHWKYQKATREEVQNLNKEKDEKIQQYHELALRQIELQTEQIQTNKRLQQTLEAISNKLDRN